MTRLQFSAWTTFLKKWGRRAVDWYVLTHSIWIWFVSAQQMNDCRFVLVLDQHMSGHIQIKRLFSRCLGRSYVGKRMNKSSEYLGNQPEFVVLRKSCTWSIYLIPLSGYSYTNILRTWIHRNRLFCGVHLIQFICYYCNPTRVYAKPGAVA